MVTEKVGRRLRHGVRADCGVSPVRTATLSFGHVEAELCGDGFDLGERSLEVLVDVDGQRL